MINCFVRSPVFQGDPSMKVFCLFPAYSAHTVFTEHTKNLLVTSDVTYPFFFSFFSIYFKPQWPVSQLQQFLAKNEFN